MDVLHSLLQRQVRRHLGPTNGTPPGVEALIREVDEAYRGNDADRAMLERSLELSSKELFERNAEMRAIFGALPDVIMRLGADGTILDVKSGHPQDLGLRPGVIGGTRLQDASFVDGSDVGALVEAATTARTPTRGCYRIEVDGQEQHHEIRLLPFLDSQLIGIIANVTDLRRAEEQRRKAEERSAHSQRLESLGVLAGGIAHEINTPTQYVGDNTRFFGEAFRELAGLVTQLRKVLTMAREGPVPDDLLDAVQAAIDGADLDYLLDETPRAIQQSIHGVERVTRIVQAMKEFSHVSVEKLPTDIASAIESTVTVASNEWKYVADVVTDFDDELPLVHCVAGRFNQVILNLVVNAAHAIAELSVKQSSRKGIITIRTRRVGDCAEITVEDTGIGMTEEVQARIFDPFYTTKAVGRGTGQGLSIAHTVVVKEHGGSITVHSQPGRGTTFKVLLPIKSDSDREVAA